jgi:ABC-type Fe3+-hydroxamate transport system substrate-binding protein
MMRTFAATDDRGKRLSFRQAPSRIVSLVPSDTHSLIQLGVKERLIGRTRYCVEPAADVASIEEVGGTKDANVERILALEPDLVVANQEENSRADIEKLEQAGLKVLLSFPCTVRAGIGHFARLARLLGVEADPVARAAIQRAYGLLKDANAAPKDARLVRVFVPIWMDPLMTINAATFISDVVTTVGGDNVFADRERRYPLAADHGKRLAMPADRVAGRDTRYPRVTMDEVIARAPELVLLPDEPHPFSEVDADVFRAALPNAQVVRCDGKDLMWYGARSVEGLRGLGELCFSVKTQRT